ncbi:MAG TPA: 1-deoxy-D-xylulose-5-phosphate reductoisomerase [Actinomycetota bacterium]
MRRIVILGSTGSIGTQALDVVRKHRDRFEVMALVAGRNAELLAEQVDEFSPALAVLAEGEAPPGSYFSTGAEAVLEAAAHPSADLVLNAIVGSRGLGPSLAALDAGKTLALANKESIIAGGDLVMARVAGAPERLVPVDSEHSGLFQCLGGRAARREEVRRVILTASGGPFRGRRAEELASVTVAEALAHPTWSMGAKITVDSATLMNKGLEAIEAHHLFGVAMDDVAVVVHPQSIVHGIVEFVDGSFLAQASTPDMRLPIQVALAWPERLADGAEPLDWASLGSLDFEPVDRAAFPALDLAFDAGRRGGSYPAVLNAANEEAVGAFLAGRAGFADVPRIVAAVLAEHDAAPIGSLGDVLAVEQWARARANELADAR